MMVLLLPLPAISFFLFAVLCYGIVWIIIGKRDGKARKRPISVTDIKQTNPYEEILPLDQLEWSKTSPIKQHPFKEKYYLTMALEQCAISELIQVDSTYLERLKIRRQLHDSDTDLVLQCNPVADNAVTELYEWMMTTYLPRRFPTMYRLSEARILQNLVTGEDIPLYHASEGSVMKLRQLSSHVDNDFLFLLPESCPSAASPAYPGPNFLPASFAASHGSSHQAQGSSGECPKYHLHAFAATFPSGFSWLQKLGLPLAAIHAPVPEYAPRLERSMDRFFASLPPGRVAARRNWSVTTNDELFNLGSNHGDAKDEDGVRVADSLEEQFAGIQGAGDDEDEISIDNMRLRVERQTLHRLPKTGALIFGFKTYQYRLDDVKEDGGGEGLATAIEGLWQGNAKRMVLYKRANIWGKKVVDYLRT